MIAKFIGKEISLGYEPGKMYALIVHEPGAIERFWRGYHHNWCVIIVSPYFCPYSNWQKFYENWEVTKA
jgi:hypothetical protein